MSTESIAQAQELALASGLSKYLINSIAEAHVTRKVYSYISFAVTSLRRKTVTCFKFSSDC
jgi:hypothetical protein